MNPLVLPLLCAPIMVPVMLWWAIVAGACSTTSLEALFSTDKETTL